MAGIPDEVVPVSTTVLGTSAGRPTAASVRDLVERLGPHVVWPAGGADPLLDAVAGEPVVHGVGEPVSEVAGAVVLLVGVRPDRDDVAGQVHDLARAGAVAVVLKAQGSELGRETASAADAGVALLVTPDETSWRHLDALLTAARLAHAGVGEDAAAPHGTGDLFALANHIAGALGGAVSVEEPSGRVLAYSNLPGQDIDEIRRLGILGRQTPARPTNAEEYRTIMQAVGPVFFESDRPDYSSRLAVSVRAGHQVVGVIFVLCDRDADVAAAEPVLADAARAAALHLLRARGHGDPERERRQAVLRGLVTGNLDATAAGQALGLDGFRVALAVVRPESAVGQRSLEALRVADVVALHGEHWHSGAVSAVVDGQVLVLLPLAGDHAAAARDRADDGRLSAELHRLGDGLVAAARRSAQVGVRVGVAPPVPDLRLLPASLRYAEQVLDVLERQDATVATLAEVRTDVVVAALGSESAVRDPELLLPQVRAILEHDATQGTDYARTLLTYVGSFGDVAHTAQRLQVHENTARYRVRRLAELFGVDLAAGDEALVVWLQLRARTR